MEVVIDGKRGPVLPPGVTTFKELLDSLSRAASEQRRVIVSVKLDGVALSREMQAKLQGETLPSEGRLDIGTVDRQHLAVDTLSDLLESLTPLERAHQEAAELVIGARYKDAMGKFKECFEGWARIMKGVGTIAAGAGVDLGALQADGRPLAPGIQKIQEALSNFKEAFDRTDVVRLGDLTQYDLKPLLTGCRSMLEALRQRILESVPSSR
jgi:hypothetical protein